MRSAATATRSLATSALLEREALTEKDAEAEAAGFGELMAASYGRDPRELPERYRRKGKEGGLDYWATGAVSTLADFATAKTRIDAILFGDCDVHMEADFPAARGGAARDRPARGRDLPGRHRFRRRASARRDPDRRAALASRAHVATGGAQPPRDLHRRGDAPDLPRCAPGRRADPDRQPAGADGAAVGHGRARSRRNRKPLSARQPQPCGAGRGLRRRARGRRRRGAGGGRVGTHARRRPGGFHPLRLTGLECSARKSETAAVHGIVKIRPRWRRPDLAIPTDARRSWRASTSMR